MSMPPPDRADEVARMRSVLAAMAETSEGLTESASALVELHAALATAHGPDEASLVAARSAFGIRPTEKTP